MNDVSILALARFSREVLYDVEVTLEGHPLFPEQRQDAIRDALEICSVDMVLLDAGGESVDHQMALSLDREDPCRPWSWSNS